jgi:hypothetical protein
VQEALSSDPQPCTKIKISVFAIYVENKTYTTLLYVSVPTGQTVATSELGSEARVSCVNSGHEGNRFAFFSKFKL